MSITLFEVNGAALPLTLYQDLPMEFSFMFYGIDTDYTWTNIKLQFNTPDGTAWVDAFEHIVNDGIDLDARLPLSGGTPSALSLQPGRFVYRIVMQGQTTVPGKLRSREIVVAAGNVEITAGADNSYAHASEMLSLIRRTLQSKMSGRGDIAKYTIGGRDVETMSIKELEDAAQRYVEQMQRMRNGKINWHAGRRGVNVI